MEGGRSCMWECQHAPGVGMVLVLHWHPSGSGAKGLAEDHFFPNFERFWKGLTKDFPQISRDLSSLCPSPFSFFFCFI